MRYRKLNLPYEKTSIQDYDGYKERIVETFRGKYADKYVDKFREFISNRYDKIRRTFLHKLCLWRLMDDHAKLKNEGMLLYAIVGLGGSGKTTLACNMAYFHDPTIDGSRVVWGFEDMVKKIKELNHDKFKAIIVDEPNDVPTSNSMKGKALAEVFGQWRQDNPVVFFCSTDMKDIPPTAFRKLNAIVYIKSKGKAIYIRDIPYLDIYPLSEIKNVYSRKGYKAFVEVIEKSKIPFLKFDTYKTNVLEVVDKNFHLKYYSEKRKKFDDSIENFLTKRHSKKEKILEEYRKNKNVDLNELRKKYSTSMAFIKNAIVSEITEEGKKDYENIDNKG